jgi:hypothetical protein
VSFATLSNHKPLIAVALLAAALLLAYVPDLGHGFIKDDFGWIRGARIESADDAAGLLTRNNGFYRPLVSASFALNYAVSGMAPLAYGVTNFALLLAGAALLFMVARRLNLPATPSALASALWVFNFHGINMAVLWVSGRTALLLSCAALASTLGRRRIKCPARRGTRLWGFTTAGSNPAAEPSGAHRGATKNRARHRRNMPRSVCSVFW